MKMFLKFVFYKKQNCFILNDNPNYTCWWILSIFMDIITYIAAFWMLKSFGYFSIWVRTSCENGIKKN